MGIGLSTQIVNTNRLPGWDKMSYGYHGDDGNAFCGSGTGQVVSSKSTKKRIRQFKIVFLLVSSHLEIPVNKVLSFVFDTKSLRLVVPNCVIIPISE